MAAKAKARRDAEIEEEFGYIRIEEPWRFDIDHPKNADHCRDCTEWRLYNPSAPWLGYGWWVTCHDGPFACKFNHDHHDNDFYLASMDARHVVHRALAGDTIRLTDGVRTRLVVGPGNQGLFPDDPLDVETHT